MFTVFWIELFILITSRGNDNVKKKCCARLAIKVEQSSESGIVVLYINFNQVNFLVQYLEEKIAGPLVFRKNILQLIIIHTCNKFTTKEALTANIFSKTIKKQMHI